VVVIAKGKACVYFFFNPNLSTKYQNIIFSSAIICLFILQLNVKETRTDRPVQNVSYKSMQDRKYFDHYYSQKFTIMGYV
jgi:hypothetical protein